MKPKSVIDENSRNVEEILNPPKKRKEMSTKQDKYYKMEHHKISKILNDATLSKFVTRKWVEVNDLSSGRYSLNKNMRFAIPSDLRDCSDINIVVKRRITFTGDTNANIRSKKIKTLTNNAPFRSCI